MWKRLQDRLRGSIIDTRETHSTVASRQTMEEPRIMRTLMIVFSPRIEHEGGRPLYDILGWNDPSTLAQQYIADLEAASGGFARYQIVENIEVDQWPVKIDGFRYDDRTFLQAWRQRTGFHEPDGVDYDALLRSFDIVERVDANDIDEVWIFAPPYTGLWESTMAGPGAFWCNSAPITGTGRCARRFVIMGFNYERDVGCMLENFGHRTESIMSAVYRNMQGDEHMWDHFCRYDRSTPGRASCGNVHFAPSSQSDYDWGNPRIVPSDCDDWYSYPRLPGHYRDVQCREWGAGDMRAHHLWWLDHLPRFTGIHNGVANNWWRYILDPNLVGRTR